MQRSLSTVHNETQNDIKHVLLYESILPETFMSDT